MKKLFLFLMLLVPLILQAQDRTTLYPTGIKTFLLGTRPGAGSMTADNDSLNGNYWKLNDWLYRTPGGKMLYVSSGFTGFKRPYFTTVQMAIDSALTDSTVIMVYPGTYVENLTISKGVFILGQNRQNTKISSTSTNAVHILSTSATIAFKNITISTASTHAILVDGTATGDQFYESDSILTTTSGDGIRTSTTGLLSIINTGIRTTGTSSIPLNHLSSGTVRMDNSSFNGSRTNGNVLQFTTNDVDAINSKFICYGTNAINPDFIINTSTGKFTNCIVVNKYNIGFMYNLNLNYFFQATGGDTVGLYPVEAAGTGDGVAAIKVTGAITLGNVTATSLPSIENGTMWRNNDTLKLRIAGQEQRFFFGTPSVGQYLAWNGRAWVATNLANITSINGLSGPAITFLNGTTGTAPNFAASGSNITLHIPNAGAGVTQGGVTNSSQTIAGNKTLSGTTSTAGRNIGSTQITTTPVTLDGLSEIWWFNPNSVGADMVANLPDATTVVGRTYIIYRYSGTGNTNKITVTPFSGQTIEGVSTYVLQNDYDCISIVATPFGWKHAAQPLIIGFATVPVGLDSVDIPITGMTSSSMTLVSYSENVNDIIPTSSPVALARTNKITIKTHQFFDVNVQLTFQFKKQP